MESRTRRRTRRRTRAEMRNSPEQGNMLAEILANKRLEVREAKDRRPAGTLEEEIRRMDPPRSLIQRITDAGGPAHRVIAELKRASPSKGILRADLDPVDWAGRYVRAGAVGLSVLTDEKFFKGTLDDLARIREHVDLPLLRKDFLIDTYQVVEARASGADAVLLIMRILEDGRFADLLHQVREAGMEALVEVHNEEDLERALARGTRLLGINNRDLSRFKTDLDVTRRLMPRIPADVVVVSASGINEPEQVRSLEADGVKAFLVGEALMKAADPEEKLRELVT
jgi:indole-3-glycerol phosphate synthase